MLITALLLSAVLTAPQAPDDPVAPQDGVVATAPATPVLLDGAAGEARTALPAPPQIAVDGLTTDVQIAQWLRARAAEPALFDGAPAWRDDRKPHGEISVGVGTGGYRDYGVAMSLPIGESGRLDLRYHQVENAYPFGHGYDSYGYGGYGADGGLMSSGTRMQVDYGYEEAWGRSPRRRPDVDFHGADQQ